MKSRILFSLFTFFVGTNFYVHAMDDQLPGVVTSTTEVSTMSSTMNTSQKYQVQDNKDVIVPVVLADDKTGGQEGPSGRGNLLNARRQSVVTQHAQNGADNKSELGVQSGQAFTFTEQDENAYAQQIRTINAEQAEWLQILRDQNQQRGKQQRRAALRDVFTSLPDQSDNKYATQYKSLMAPNINRHKKSSGRHARHTLTIGMVSQSEGAILVSGSIVYPKPKSIKDFYLMLLQLSKNLRTADGKAVFKKYMDEAQAFFDNVISKRYSMVQLNTQQISHDALAMLKTLYMVEKEKPFLHEHQILKLFIFYNHKGYILNYIEEQLLPFLTSPLARLIIGFLYADFKSHGQICENIVDEIILAIQGFDYHPERLAFVWSQDTASAAVTENKLPVIVEKTEQTASADIYVFCLGEILKRLQTQIQCEQAHVSVAEQQTQSVALSSTPQVNQLQQPVSQTNQPVGQSTAATTVSSVKQSTGKTTTSSCCSVQ